jgi:hypothetical protein
MGKVAARNSRRSAARTAVPIGTAPTAIDNTTSQRTAALMNRVPLQIFWRSERTAIVSVEQRHVGRSSFLFRRRHSPTAVKISLLGRDRAIAVSGGVRRRNEVSNAHDASIVSEPGAKET